MTRAAHRGAFMPTKKIGNPISASLILQRGNAGNGEARDPRLEPPTPRPTAPHSAHKAEDGERRYRRDDYETRSALYNVPTLTLSSAAIARQPIPEARISLIFTASTRTLGLPI